MSRLLAASHGGGGFDAVPAYDDEFDGTGSTWVYSGSTSPDIDSTAAGRLYMPSGSAAHRVGLPPIPFTVTAFLAAVTVDSLSTPGNATMAIAEATPASSPGPIWWGPEMPDIDVPGNTARYDGRFANFAATPTHLGTKVEAAGHVHDVPTYQQILVHSATNMDLFWSHDNVTYTAYGTGFNPTLTPGAIIFISFAMTTEWDWLRFRSGATSGPA